MADYPPSVNANLPPYLDPQRQKRLKSIRRLPIVQSVNAHDGIEFSWLTY